MHTLYPHIAPLDVRYYVRTDRVHVLRTIGIVNDDQGTGINTTSGVIRVTAPEYGDPVYTLDGATIPLSFKDGSGVTWAGIRLMPNQSHMCAHCARADMRGWTRHPDQHDAPKKKTTIATLNGDPMCADCHEHYRAWVSDDQRAQDDLACADHYHGSDVYPPY